MTRSWNVLLALMLAAPAFAQETPSDQPPADQGSADQSAAPSDQGAGQAAPADQGAAAPEEGQPAPTEEAAPADTTSESGGGGKKPWQLYAGADYVTGTLSSSNLSGFGSTTFDTGMYRVRAGARVLEAVGLEAQFGVKRGGDSLGEAKTKTYYGVFAVPTATLFETVELGFPVGYARSSVEMGGASANLNSMAYGVSAELPIKKLAGSLPDIRITAGGMVFYQRTDARMYGWDAGLRYDFSL